MPLEMCSSFNSFTKLPFELQHMIWTFTISYPRMISGHTCFREWWNGNIVAFLVPAALHVCRFSRFVASSALKRSSLQIPGIPGWRTIYINRSWDSFILTERELQNISSFIADPALIARLAFTKNVKPNNTARNDSFRQLTGLRQIIMIGEEEVYWAEQRDDLFPGRGIMQRRIGEQEWRERQLEAKSRKKMFSFITYS